MNIANVTDVVVRRFTAKYKINPETGCWEWLAGRFNKDYGCFAFDGKMVKAHRFSYLLHNSDPTGGFVCHHCDNPTCVNPDHLYLGDFQSNSDDRLNRGRHAGCASKAPPRVVGFGIAPLQIAKERGKCAQYCKKCGHHRIDDLPRSGSTSPRCRNCKRQHVRNSHSVKRALKIEGLKA
jgi:hypothetical protein